MKPEEETCPKCKKEMELSDRFLTYTFRYFGINWRWFPCCGVYLALKEK